MSGVNKGLLAMLAGAGAGAGVFGSPEDAGAEARSDLLEALNRVINDPTSPSRLFVGKMPKTAWEDAQALNSAYRDPETWLSWHGANSRFEKDGMAPSTFAEMLKRVLDSEKTRTIPGFPSKKNVKRTAPQALWLPEDAESPYFSIAPTKDGKVLLVTGFHKDTGQIIDHVVEQNWNPDSRQSIISGVHRTLSAGEPSPQPRRISAVGPQFTGTSLGDLLAKGKGKLPGIAGIPAGAIGFGDMTSKGDWSPGNALRQIGLGTRALMEGAGSALSLGLTDPGRVLADLAGLPSPVPGTPEALASGVVRGGADAMSFMLPGAGMARMAAGPVARGVGQALTASPMAQTAWGSGMGLLDYMLQSAGGKRQN